MIDAFDNGLIYRTPDFKMKLLKLTALNLAGGHDNFRQYLDHEILLSANPRSSLLKKISRRCSLSARTSMLPRAGWGGSFGGHD